MARRNKIPGSFEIWSQREGEEPKFITSLHNDRDVENVLLLLADQERQFGTKISENDGGGFTGYIRRRNPATKKMSMVPIVHYWFETVMGDEPDIDDAILVQIAEAMIMGGLKGRAMREAIVSGIEFEEDEDE